MDIIVSILTEAVKRILFYPFCVAYPMQVDVESGLVLNTPSVSGRRARKSCGFFASIVFMAG